MLIDSHCHLDDARFSENDIGIRQAMQAGRPALIIIPAISPDNFAAVQSTAARCDNVYYLLGLHPLYADQYDLNVVAKLEAAVQAALGDPGFAGIGEIGLDFYNPENKQEPARGHQISLFEAQLELAQRYSLPISLHARKSQELILNILKGFPEVRGIAHAFSGSLEQARKYTDVGFLIGVGGAYCYTKAVRLQRTLRSLPVEALALETDAPYMSPPWLQGEANSPCELWRISSQIAAVRAQESHSQLIENTGANVLNLFSRIDVPADFSRHFQHPAI